MTKKELVQRIKGLLHNLNTPKNGCQNIYYLSNVSWVGYNQVCKREHLDGALYRNYRVKLYSKHMSLDDLWTIHNELRHRIKTLKNVEL